VILIGGKLNAEIEHPSKNGGYGRTGSVVSFPGGLLPLHRSPRAVAVSVGK
jgi:hypothetical protein